MYETTITSHTPFFRTPGKYVKDKLKILKRDFCIDATEEEIAHLNTLTTQIQIDNAILSIIARRWDR